MKYALLLYEAPEDFAARADQEDGTFLPAYVAYAAAIREAGVWDGTGNALQGPGMATTVRLDNGRRIVQDGPYADTKEQLGGFLLLDVSDLAEALKWAAACPCAHRGRVEVRPVWEPVIGP